MNEADNILAFQRWDQHGPGDDVVVVLNFSNAPNENYEIGMPSPGLWKLRLNSDATVYSSDFQGFASGDVEALEGPRDGLDAYATISIGPYSMLVYTQENDQASLCRSSAQIRRLPNYLPIRAAVEIRIETLQI